MNYFRIFALLFFLVFQNGAWAANYLLLSSETATNSNTGTNSFEAFLDSKKHSDPDYKKKWSYNIDLNGTEENVPTSYPTLVIPGTKFNSRAFATTLYNTDESIDVELVKPHGWLFGFGYEYSRQQASGTPNTFSNTFSAVLGEEIEYGKNDEPSSFKWKITATTGGLNSDSYFVLRDNGTLYPEPANAITQNSGKLGFTWDPEEWITLETSYQQYSYTSDPNSFALLKSPKRGLPTSLDSYEIMGVATFHLGESWDFEFKEFYSVAATSDQTVTDEETYSLTYMADAFELSLGYDHQNPNTSTPTDSTLISLRLNF
jgi:hypothetical protein